eukprot:486941_1
MAQNDASIPNIPVNDEQKNKDEKHQFSVGSFNIWCPRWNGQESNYPQLWKKRHNDILNALLNNNNENENNKDTDDNKQQELKSMNCDIYCLQEFWCDREPFVRMYENYFKARNYSLHFFKRTNKYKPDGIAILINNKTFKLINNKTINSGFDISNRVIMIAQLLHIKSNCIINIANTHLTYPQEDYDQYIRAQQVKIFIELITKNTNESVSIAMACGDFNCEIDGNEAIECIKDGYKSSFHVVNANMKQKVVSHLNHENESVFVDHIFYKKNPNVLKDNSFAINCIDSYLYPRDMKCDRWYDEWTLSDHRPIVSTFEIKHD